MYLSLALPVLGYALLTAGVTATATLYGLWVRRYEPERAAAKLDRAVGEGRMYTILVTLAGVGLLVAFAGPLTERLELALPAAVPRPLATVGLVAGFVGLLAAGTLCWYAPLAYARVAATDTERTVSELLGQFGRTLLVYGGLLVPPLTVWLIPGIGLAWSLATIGVLRALYHPMRPHVARFTRPTRSPTTDERERLEAACEAIGFEPHAIHVVESDRAGGTGMSYDGLPGRRTVFVAERFLSGADESQLRTTLVHLDSIRRTGFIERRTAIVAGSVLASAGLLSPLSPVSGLETVLLLGVVVVGATVLSSRLSGQIYRADRTAADRAGARELVAVFEWWLDECGEDESTHGRLVTALTSQPPIGRRLTRLRERAAGTNPAD